jgi:hypothetical protein
MPNGGTMKSKEIHLEDCPNGEFGVLKRNSSVTPAAAP